MDPLTQQSIIQGAAESLTKELVSLVKIGGRSLSRYVQDGLLSRAKPQSDANLAELDLIFAKVNAVRAERIKSTGGSPAIIERVLEDPDMAHALRAAMYAGSRSNSTALRHQLANALSARFSMETGSNKAVVMNRAIEVLSHLGTEHLKTLAVLALTYCIQRPSPERAEAIAKSILARCSEPQFDYGPVTILWSVGDSPIECPSEVAAKVAHLALYEPLETVKAHEALHLASLGCVNYDATALRDLSSNIIGQELEGLSTGRGHQTSFLQLDWLSAIPTFTANWVEVLQHCTLSPVGLVIGLLVHDQKTGSNHLNEWEWGQIDIHDVITDVGS